MDFGEQELIHSKIIRDADKLDNFRVRKQNILRIFFLVNITQILWNMRLFLIRFMRIF